MQGLAAILDKKKRVEDFLRLAISVFKRSTACTSVAPSASASTFPAIFTAPFFVNDAAGAYDLNKSAKEE